MSFSLECCLTFITPSSIIMRALDTAKVPRSKGTRGIPGSNTDIPNVKRVKLVEISVPTVATRRPMTAEIIPLMVDPCTITATVDSPSRHRTVYSGGPTFSANLAKRGENSINMKALIRPPQTEAVVIRPMAFPVSPRSDMGLASSKVAAAIGVPGIPKTVEVIPPPSIPPT